MNNLILMILMPCIAFLNAEYNYKFVETPMTMSNARKNCQKWGGELVTIQDAAQNAFIYREIKKRKFDKAWIGLNDIKKEGKFEWVDTMTCATYINWGENEPNNHNGDNEDCTEIRVSWSGKWNDLACTYKRPSVCYKTDGIELKDLVDDEPERNEFNDADDESDPEINDIMRAF